MIHSQEILREGKSHERKMRGKKGKHMAFNTSVNPLVLIMVLDPVGTLSEVCNRGSQPEGLTPRPST
jgi:hypothetical protein